MDKIISPWDNSNILISHVNYSKGLNWESQAAPVKEASPFWQGLRQIFPHLCDFFYQFGGWLSIAVLVGCLVVARNFEGGILVALCMEPYSHSWGLQGQNLESSIREGLSWTRGLWNSCACNSSYYIRG